MAVVKIKKQKAKKNVSKKKVKFGNYKNCLEATQLLENEINHLEQNENDVDSLKKDQKTHKKQ